MLPRALLFVQCEGNGHFSQAIAIRRIILTHQIMDIVGVILNENKKHTIPSYFLDAFHDIPIYYVKGPILVRQTNQHTNTNTNTNTSTLVTIAASITKLSPTHVQTILHNITHAQDYFQSLEQIHHIVTQHKPVDVFLNLFDLLPVWYINKYYKYMSTINNEHQHQHQHQHHQHQHHLHLINIATQFKSLLPFTNTFESTRTISPLSKTEHDKQLNASLFIVKTCFLPNLQPHNNNNNNNNTDDTNNTIITTTIALCPLPVVTNVTNMKVCPCFVNIPDDDNNNTTTTSVQLQKKDEKDIYIVGYITHPGYMEQLTYYCQHADNKNLFHFDIFCRQTESCIHVLPNLTTFALNRNHFLRCLQQSDGFLGTAGIESICEALYFGKPVCIVPCAYDDEQFVNASFFIYNLQCVQAQKDFTNMNSFLQYAFKCKYLQQQKQQQQDPQFKQFKKEITQIQNWLNQSEQLFVEHIRKTLSTAATTTTTTITNECM